MANETTQNLSHTRVLRIAIPIVLANATVPILGAVDTGVVGQLGLAAPIGAVGIGAIIISAIYWIFGFLRMGTSGMTAQAMGAKDDAEVSALLVRALIIGFVAGAIFFALQMPLFWGSFQLAPASPEVEEMAREYLGIRIVGAPASIALFGVGGWLIATERTRAVLALTLYMNGLNILLDLWFVLSLELGIAGVAWATVISEWTGLGLGLWLCRSGLDNNRWRQWARIFDMSKLQDMATVNRDILLRSVLLEAGFVSFLFLGASFNDVVLAANQVLLQFLYITAFALDGFAFAATALVGQAMGAKDRMLLRRSTVLTSIWGGAIVAILAVGFLLAGPFIISVMTTSVKVQNAAGEYLPWLIIAPVCGWAAWMLDGVFIGATRTRDMRNMMAISFLVHMVAVWLLLEPWGNHGLWAALMIFFVVRGITLAWRYPALEASVEA